MDSSRGFELRFLESKVTVGLCFLEIYFTFIYVFVCMTVRVCVHMSAGASVGQKRAYYLLELELQELHEFLELNSVFCHDGEC